MSARRPTEICPKAVVSLSEMASMLGLSRSRFYDLIEQGVFEHPIYDLRTRRPLFTAEMQRRNLFYRQTNTAADGRYVCFYRPRGSPSASTDRPLGAASQQRAGNHVELIAELRELGLHASDGQVQQAVQSLFPAGTVGLDESDVLREVFRHLRRSPISE